MLPHPPRTMPTFRSELGTEEGEDACGGGGWTSGNDETDLSRSGGASSSVECKPGSQNASPLSGPRARR